MKKWIAFAAFAGLLQAQALIEHAAAATGGTVGGVAGKKVSDGLSKIFEKVDTTTRKAAKAGDNGKARDVDAKGAPLLQVGPGSPIKGRDTSGVVPPPPPARRAGVQTQAPPAPAPAPVVVAQVPPPPPLPEVKLDDLKKITAGTKREEVLKLGPPASRVTMFDDGHLLEIYRYMAGDMTLGVVRLVDGSVASLLIR
ncbi:MAG TPA: hypothetical protein VGP79_03915 [Bryobacteraceae bacterium]|jgi:hypothetical protein|nr:hypothetical protein [Bryobacteraceae bacterium]